MQYESTMLDKKLKQQCEIFMLSDDNYNNHNREREDKEQMKCTLVPKGKKKRIGSHQDSPLNGAILTLGFWLNDDSL